MFVFSIHQITFASFPVTGSESTETEIITSESLKTHSNIELTNSESFTVSPAVYGGGKGISIAAMVCGIVGLFAGGIILGPLAIIFGAIGMKRDGRGMAITGLVTGIIASLWSILVIAAILSL
jgi:hypothetical protein